MMVANGLMHTAISSNVQDVLRSVIVVVSANIWIGLITNDVVDIGDLLNDDRNVRFPVLWTTMTILF